MPLQGGQTKKADTDDRPEEAHNTKCAECHLSCQNARNETATRPVRFARLSHSIWTTALSRKVESDLKNTASELCPKQLTKQELVISESHEESSYLPSTHTYPGSGTNHTALGAAIYGRQALSIECPGGVDTSVQSSSDEILN